MENGSKIRKPNAQWDANASKIFNEICVEQVLANNRPTSCLNSKGYANLVAQFNERTSKNYTRGQMKNQWDALKSDYVIWKALLIHASGLGRDPKTGSIATSNEWWEEKIAAMPGCKKFRLAPLENEEDLEIMFSGATCTNASAMIPGADSGADEGLTSADDDIDDVEEVPPADTPLMDRQARKRGGAHKSPVKKSKKNFRDMQFKRLVDSFVEKASSSDWWIPLWKKLVQASLLQHLRVTM